MPIFNQITLSIAINTLRGFARDKIFHATILIAILLVLFASALATLAILEFAKLLMDFSFAAISMSSILIGIFIGISSLAKEIETKIDYLILAKPVSRTDYLFGKYLGCSFVLMIVVVIMMMTIFSVIWYFGGTGLAPGFFECFFLIYLESSLVMAMALLASIFSSRVMAACFSTGFFFLGRSNYSLQKVIERNEDSFLSYIFNGVYYLSPNLERFNIRDLVAYNKPYPENFVQNGFIYYLAFSICLLICSALVFSKRDLP